MSSIDWGKYDPSMLMSKRGRIKLGLLILKEQEPETWWQRFFMALAIGYLNKELDNA